MVYITIEDEKIPVSNFAFLYDLKGSMMLKKILRWIIWILHIR